MPGPVGVCTRGMGGVRGPGAPQGIGDGYGPACFVLARMHRWWKMTLPTTGLAGSNAPSESPASSDFLLLCVLPADRASLAGAVRAAGGTPVVDLTAGGTVGPLAAGVWVRVRDGRSVPGTGPVLLAAGSTPRPLANRETWLEVTTPGPVPAGLAGVVLRGVEVGGPCGAAPAMSLLAQMPPGVPVVVDGGLKPDAVAGALRAGAAGVVLSDVLMATPEMALPSGLRQRMDVADASSSHLINGFRIQASPLAPVLRRLLSGESFWDLSQGWLGTDSPGTVAWPAGRAIADAPELARQYGTLAGLVGAARAALSAVERAPGPPHLRVWVWPRCLR